MDLELAVGLDLFDVTAGHHPRRLLLGGKEEVLHVAGCAHVLVDHRVLDRCVDLRDLHHLPQRVDAALGRAVLEVIFVARAGALDVGDPFRRAAVGWAGDLSADQHGFELVRGHDIRGRPVAEVAELGSVVRNGAGRLDDRADGHFKAGRTVEVDLELAGLAVDLDDAGRGQDLDLVAGLDLLDELRDRVGLRLFVGRFLGRD